MSHTRTIAFEGVVKEIRMHRETTYDVLRIRARDDAGLAIEWNEPVLIASQYRVGAKVRVRIDVSLDHLSPEVTLTEWAQLMLSRNTQTEILQQDSRILSELGVPEADNARALVLFERHPPLITALLAIEHTDAQGVITEWVKEKQISRRTDEPIEGILLRTFRELAGEARREFNSENGDRYIELETDPDPPPNPDPVDDMPF